MQRSDGTGRGEGTTVPGSQHAVSIPRLQIVVETEAGEPASREAVIDDDCFRIGSHPSNNLVVDDPRVSRFHCRVERETAQHAASIREGFLALAARAPERYAVVDAARPVHEVAADVRAAVERLL